MEKKTPRARRIRGPGSRGTRHHETRAWLDLWNIVPSENNLEAKTTSGRAARILRWSLEFTWLSWRTWQLRRNEAMTQRSAVTSVTWRKTSLRECTRTLESDSSRCACQCSEGSSVLWLELWRARYLMATATHGFDRLCPVLWRCDRTLGWDTKRHPAQCINSQEAQCTQQAHTSTQGLHQKVGHEAEILPYYETSLPHIRSHASICAVRDEWSMKNRCHRQSLSASASGASRTVPKLLGESPQWSNVKRVIFASGVFVDWSIHLIWSARRRRDGDWRGRTFCCEHVVMKEALPNATVRILSVWLALERVQPSRTDHDDSFAHSCCMVARWLTCQGKARFIETSHHGCEHVAQWMCEVIINFVLWML